MKIALFHNFMDNIGGAEIVTLTLARELNADIYTTNINGDHIKEMGFEDVLPRIQSIGKIPIQAPFRHQFCFYKFWRLNLSKYKPDLKYDKYIISGDWAMSGATHNKPNLWYVHSPLHELWELKQYIRNSLPSLWKKLSYDVWVWFNRKLTLRYAKHIDTITCNSVNTKDRIKKYYKREAMVVNPPVYTNDYSHRSVNPETPTNSLQNTKYWLSVNRLFANKRIEIQLEAFRNMPDQKLIIVGSYEKGAQQFESYKKKLEDNCPSNVVIQNWVSREELIDLYTNCTGFITTSLKEDFGLTAVEALASGKPVIAPNEGGYKETIVDGVHGVLIDEIDADKVINAVTSI
ncbi:MAG: glycosyltransferase, partial [Candidatus Pacebacteria bacterium]|nr:glycosyltransferase [Candidatus Paceibacterota bacterium]